MDSNHIVTEIAEALKQRKLPTAVVWNRLEGRPNKDDFGRALKAEVRDALWMVGKQWQMGEFQGDDAGTPLLAKIRMAQSQLEKFQAADNPAIKLDPAIPLEALAEKRKLALVKAGKKMSLDLRVQFGRQWMKMLKQAGLDGNFKAHYLETYSFQLPDKQEDEDVFAHRETWQQLSAIAGRLMDGGELYLSIDDMPDRVSGWITKVATDQAQVIALTAQVDALAKLGQKFVEWVNNIYLLPESEAADAWLPERLEYQFSTSAPQGNGTEKVFSAQEYYSGHLDWYSFDVNPSRKQLGENVSTTPPKSILRTVIPSSVEFEGMPNRRWWKFEDGKTNFGDVKASTSDLAKLLFIEFGLVYSNDWFIVPFTLETGTFSTIDGMMVRNSFGERFWIEPSGKGKDDDWHRWTMFTNNVSGKNDAQNAELGVLLAPALPKIQEGDPLEEVSFIRDEIANMVWAVESMVPLATGVAKPGKETAAENRAFHEELNSRPASNPPSPKASISYLAMTQVPENWIPFIPVLPEAGARNMQLQRGSMLRVFEGVPPEQLKKVKPHTSILREGLDQNPQKKYFLYEEEVPRSGITVSKSFQRSRGTNGKPYVWVGMRKQTGRGEGSSGLAFDKLVDVKSSQPGT